MSIAHFYIPEEGVIIPDPGVTFVVVQRGVEGYQDWAPIRLSQVFPSRSFARVNDNKKVVIDDYDAQHQAAEFTENWAQVIRLQNWLKEAQEA